ncbi:MAG: hypothetical protein QNJ38_23600 [Prochloraceae cyanobacterium]|nr:hypothetical protein [Prochloraceae cyanobacterium]
MNVAPKIEKVICTPIGILIILNIPGPWWQFCCVYRSGLTKTSKHFHTAAKAETEGRWWLDCLDCY